jgi:transcriptional regulator with XRE-family HTH domain
MKSPELRKVNRWLRKHQMRIADLAARAGLTRTTVYNLLSGTSKSAIGRQKLTNAMRVVLWKGCTPQAVTTLNPSDPSSLKLANELAKKSPAGIQFEVQNAPSGSTTRGFLGRDGRGVLFNERTQIECPDESNARELASEIASEIGAEAAVRRGRTLTFVKPVEVSFEIEKPESGKAQIRKLSASSQE